MKKKIILLALSLMLFATGVSASSLNGDYKGYSIINLKVDNYDTSPDVPAINFEGTTMVPVRFVSESLGSDVSWRDDTQTVYIATNKISIRFMKLHHRLSNSYQESMGIGVNLENIYKDLILVYSLKDNKQLALNYLINVVKTLEQQSTNLSELNKKGTLLDILAEGTNINLQVYKESLKIYENSINYYILAIKDLTLYFDNYEQSKFDSFSNNSKNALSNLQKAIDTQNVEKRNSDDYIYSVK